MTVGRLMREMSAREYGEWKALDRVWPIGSYRADLRAANIAATMANCHKTKGDPFSVDDFLLFKDEKPKESPKQMFDKLISNVKKLGGR